MGYNQNMEHKSPEAINSFYLTAHAQMQMKRRGIKGTEVAQVLAQPEQILPAREGRWVYQSRLVHGEPPRLFLLRVVVEAEHETPWVITAYWTSHIAKYMEP